MGITEKTGKSGASYTGVSLIHDRDYSTPQNL
jgi:hypothetical protein